MSTSGRFIVRTAAVVALAWVGISSSHLASADSNETTLGGSLTVHFSSLAMGDEHSCVLTTYGEVKCWGDNSYGQLGDETTKSRTTPVKVANLESKVRAISAAEGHTCALLTTGGVKCWGAGRSGEIGDGAKVGRLSATSVDGLANGVTAISAGGKHTCALLENGGVKCWGDNFYGELGTNDTVDRTTPTDVIGLASGVASISAGKGHTCASLISGGMKCWGDNLYGQLGDNTVKRQLLPTSVVGLSSSYIRVNAVSASTSHTCAVLSVGGVKCWGENNVGQVGDNTLVNRKIPTSVTGLSTGVTGISTGRFHTCALLSTGGVKCWGTRIGLNNAPNDTTPTEVSGLSTGVNALSSGYEHVCVLLSNSSVKCWGWNEAGQLGLGEGAVSNSAEAISVLGLSESVGPTTTAPSTSILASTSTAPTSSSQTTPASGDTSAPGAANTTAPGASNNISSTSVAGAITGSSQRRFSLRIGATSRISRILPSMAIVVPSRARVSASSLTPKICSVSGGTKVKGLRFGTCRLKVSIVSPASKSSRATIRRIQIAIN
jgi:alpha-tubulin suppressor-like RCC1 family protein